MPNTDRDGRRILVEKATKRRNILSAAATLASTSAIVGSVHGTQNSEKLSQTIDLNIFQTKDLTVQYWGGGDPYEDWSHAEALKNTFERVVDKTSHSHNVDIIYDPIDETVDSGNEAEDAIQNSGLPTAEDSNIVLADRYGGGETSGDYCFAGAQMPNTSMGYFDVGNDPLKEPSGDSDLDNAIALLRTAHHEIGHTLVYVSFEDKCPDNFGTCNGWADHELGYSYKEGGKVYYTPMGSYIGEDDCYNENQNFCCEDIVDKERGNTYSDLNYSDCFWNYVDL